MSTSKPQSSHTAQRTATNDAALAGRFALAGTAVFSDVAVQVDFKTTLGSVKIHQGVVARYVDASNYLYTLRTGTGTLAIRKRAAGVVSLHREVALPTPSANAWYSIRLAVDSAGRAFVWAGPVGTRHSQPNISIVDPTLATGGALEDGREPATPARCATVRFPPALVSRRARSASRTARTVVSR